MVRQNFADWFSFYRRRILTSKAAVGLTTHDMERVSLGIYSIHHRAHEPLVYMELADGPKKLAYLKSVYGDPASDGTPLRQALNEVGRYFLEGDTKDSIMLWPALKTSEGLTSASDATRPSVFWDANSDVDTDTIDDSGGGCQRAFVIAMTDGYYNECLHHFQPGYQGPRPAQPSATARATAYPMSPSPTTDAIWTASWTTRSKARV